MTVVLALPKLFDDVVALFASDAAALVPPATPVPCFFGWRELAKHATSTSSGTARRVVWVPGDDANGSLGELGPARSPGGNPRPLATLGELFTVYLESADLTGADAAAKAVKAENERAQYQATRELFDAFWRAVHRTGGRNVVLMRAGWVTEKKERRFGASLRLVCALEAKVPDSILESITTDVVAEWTVEVLDVVEQGSAVAEP